MAERSGDTAFARAGHERIIDNLPPARKRRVPIAIGIPAALQNLAELAADISKPGHSFIQTALIYTATRCPVLAAW